MTSRQLNIRLANHDRDRLEALAYLRRSRASILAREIVLEYLEIHKEESGLEAALIALLERDTNSQEMGAIRHLDLSGRKPRIH